MLRAALVTVSSRSYLEGTQLMFYSFLKLHSKFKVDLILIHDEFSKQEQRELNELFGVQCLKLDIKLKNKINQLTNALPSYRKRQTRFYSLQAFKLDYDSILYVDSDIIFRKNIAEIFELKDPFSACIDLHSMLGGKRSLETFSADPLLTTHLTFNAGFFHFKPKKLDEKIYEKLLNRISIKQFSKLKSGHTDQFILNQEFTKSANIIDSKYNAYVLPARQIEQKENVESASVWHFLRHPKPWKREVLVKRLLKGRRPSAQIAEWNLLFHEFSKIMNKKMTWKEKCLSGLILLISYRD
ncbi:hypothetical protein GYB57_06645 [bacterium]|nr:hypothetical protein [bacterium]